MQPLSLLTTCALLVCTSALQLAAAPPAALHAPTAPPRSSLLLMAKKPAGGKGKEVQVVLTQPVKGVGKAGELVTVKASYMENALRPRGLCKLATPDLLVQIEAEQAAAAEAAKAARATADAGAATLATVFGGEGIFIKKKVGPKGDLFGSVTSAEVASLISERSGVAVEKKMIR